MGMRLSAFRDTTKTTDPSSGQARSALGQFPWEYRFAELASEVIL
jgi:hypothetical protein